MRSDKRFDAEARVPPVRFALSTAQALRQVTFAINGQPIDRNLVMPKRLPHVLFFALAVLVALPAAAGPAADAIQSALAGK